MILLEFNNLSSQQNVIGQNPKPRYKQNQILDSAAGIKMYNKWIESLNTDSVRLAPDGFAIQGWKEDFYSNGKILHKGFYKAGKLITFKNFFENGSCERNFSSTDPINSTMDIYFENGNKRFQINYYNGLPKKIAEYYANGLPKSIIENEKELKYIIYKKTWFANGQVQSILNLINAKDKKYTEKTYYSNGQIKEEGWLLFVLESNDYQRHGFWNLSDSTGKNKHIEKYPAFKSNAN